MPVVADANGDGRLEVIVVSSDGMVHAVGSEPIPADFDLDRDVDGDDFLAWQVGFGLTTGATKSDGDADLDGDVDGDDFLIWQIEFGSAG